MIKFSCPHCDQKLGVPDEYAGKRVRCSKCQQPSAVPVPQPSGVSDEDMLQLIPEEPQDQPHTELEEVKRNAAITSASRGRKRDNMVPPPVQRESDSRGAGASEIAKGMGKIPLSLGFSILMMAVCIILWVFVAHITGWIFGFLVLLVPTAGAWGLTYFTDNRGVMLGLLAAFIGFCGMIGGKVVLAKWVVYPMLVEEMEDEDSEVSRGFNEGFQKGIQNAAGGYQLTREDVQYYIEDEDTMVIIASLDIPIERQTIKAMYKLDDDTPDYDVDPAVVTGFEQSYERLDSWNPSQKEAFLRKHYGAFSDIQAECLAELIKDSGVGKAVTGVLAFICSFSLFDLLWFPMGIYGAYKIGAGKTD